MQTLSYKDFVGTAEVDLERGVCRGKLLFIEDLVTYEAESPKELQKEFEAAVDDYLETCVEVGKEPMKPARGVFQVRVSPELHRAAALRGIQEGSNLNAIVARALDCFLNGHEINHNHNVKITLEGQQGFQTLQSITSAPKWISEVSHAQH